MSFVFVTFRAGIRTSAGRRLEWVSPVTTDPSFVSSRSVCIFKEKCSRRLDIVFIKRLMLPQDLSHCWLTDRQRTANPALDVSNVKDIVTEQLSFWTLSLCLTPHSGALSFFEVKTSRPCTSRYADETFISLSVTISGIVECSTPINLWSTFGRSFNYLLAIRREIFIRKSWRRTTVCCLNNKNAYTLNGRNTQRLKGTFISETVQSSQTFWK